MALAKPEDVRDLAGLIRDPSDLCQLFEGTRRACEAEYMVATTVNACNMNLGLKNEAFSWIGSNIHSSGGGLADNRTAFKMLVDEKYVVEDTRDGKPILRMTQKLVDVLRGHFARKNR